MSRYDAWDESAAKVRPGRRGSRPRTKDRPKHEDAVPAVVTGVDRGRWTTLLLEGSEGSAPLASRARPHGTVVVAMRARELGRKGIVVGDDVSMLHGVTLGGTGAERGDRHPKIGRGVLLGAGAKVLGNITVGDYAKVASGSVVLKPVPAGCTTPEPSSGAHPMG